MTNKKKGKWTRRAFIGTGALAGGGLLISVGGNIYVNKKIKKYSGKGFNEGNFINAWISISPDNKITIAVPRAEMGQGVNTSVPMLIAEELEADMSQIDVFHPQPESPYANTFLVTQKEPNAYQGMSMVEKLYAFLPVVATGGSTTIRDGYNNLRYAGATAREMLKAAAADKWSVQASACKAKSGFIYHPSSGERLSYGDLAEVASKIVLDELPTLKKPSDWTLLRTPVQRLDIPEKVNGSAIFGIDVRPEGLLFAAFRHPSTIGGRITKINNAKEIENRSGIEKVVLTDYGAAVIGDNSWRAKNAALALKLDEKKLENENISSKVILANLKTILDQEPIATPELHGDVDTVFDDSSNTLIESTYDVPYLAHATMEPLNCTVLIDENSVDVWMGHQAPSVAHTVINKISGVSKDKINIHMVYLGGGFGRRAEPDYVEKATAVAMYMKGRPIQTLFTREEDMKNDMYRPAVASKFRAVVDKRGVIQAWENMMALQSVSNSSMNRIMPFMAEGSKNDIASTEGAIHLPYIMKNRRVALGNIDLPIQVGFWRSVGSSQNGFFTESFMDECAHEVGQDPYQFRRSKLTNHPRFMNVLDRVAEMSNWSQDSKSGVYQGIALHQSFGSIVGQVAEITQHREKAFSIDKFYCVIDCGQYINPDTIVAQMEGGIIFGLSAALYGSITWDKGQVMESNFPQYEMVRMNVSPTFEVAIMEVDESPGGVGEPGTPPAAPALTNAIFAANGDRVRSLPLIKQGYSFT